MSHYDYSIMCRHVDKETNITDCKVTGNIPDWLEGFLVYNGPGLTKINDTEYNHTFDSSAVLQKFTIKNGKVQYFNKFLQSETYKRNMKEGKITVAEFGTPGPSSKGRMARLMDALDMEKIMSDNALLAFVQFGKRYFAVGETPFYIELDPETFQVKGRINMNKQLSLTTQGIHYIKDKEGNFYSLAQSAGLTGPKYSLVKFPSDGSIEKGKIVSNFPCRWRLSPCYVHSLAMTENYIVFLETPLSVSIMELLSDVVNNRPFIEGLKWQDAGTLVNVIDRNTWKPVSKYQYVADPLFAMHFANAYEEKEQLVLDIPTYKDSSIMQKLMIKTLRDAEATKGKDFGDSFRPTLQRFVLPLNTKGVSEGTELVTLPDSKCSAIRTNNEIKLIPETLTEQPLEGPASNENYRLDGKHRYIYGIGPSYNYTNYAHLVKVDVDTKETILFKEEGMHIYFPSFVRRPEAKDEDDGILLAMALKSSDPNDVSLLVIDAKTMKEIGRAHLKAESAIAAPLHGHFFTE